MWRRRAVGGDRAEVALGEEGLEVARHRGATRRQALATLAGAAGLATPALAQPCPFLLALTPVLMNFGPRSAGALARLSDGGAGPAGAACDPAQLSGRHRAGSGRQGRCGLGVWLSLRHAPRPAGGRGGAALAGAPRYEAYLIVERGAAAHDWTDLEGDMHAFSDPDSNSGYLVTAAQLAQQGRRVESFFRGTMFTYEHRNVVRAVASGIAQSGSVDGYISEVMAETEPELAGATCVLRRSELLGFPPVVVNRGLADPGRSAALRGAQLSIATDVAGQALLAELRLDGFTELPQDHFDSIADAPELWLKMGDGA